MDFNKEKVKDYPAYQVDTNGVVYGQNGNPLKPTICRSGYALVAFSVHGKVTWHAVHRIVAAQFLTKERDEQDQVNHIDGVKTNNHVGNLEWVTGTENARHAINVLGKGTGANNGAARSVMKCDLKTGTVLSVYGSLMDAAREVGPTNTRSGEKSIYKALNGWLKTYKGFVWKYVPE